MVGGVDAASETLSSEGEFHYPPTDLGSRTKFRVYSPKERARTLHFLQNGPEELRRFPKAWLLVICRTGHFSMRRVNLLIFRNLAIAGCKSLRDARVCDGGGLV